MNLLEVFALIGAFSLGIAATLGICFSRGEEKLTDVEIDAACQARHHQFKDLAPMYQDEIREDAIAWYRAWEKSE